MTTNTIISSNNKEKDMENNDKENRQEEVNSNQRKIVLSKEQFKEFYTFITIIKPYFSDLSIKDGLFRMRSDDSSNIVETKFNYFKNMDLTIFDLKEFIKTLSTLDKEIDINVIVDENHIIFQDKYQSVQVSNGDPGFIEGQIMNNEEKKTFLKSNSNSLKLFLKEWLPKSTVCNISKTIRNFSTGVFSIKHIQNDLSKGYIYMVSSKNGTLKYSMNLRESFLTPMKKDHSLNCSNLPFIFNKDDMDISFWNNKEEILLLKYATKIDNLSVTIYGRAAFTQN